MSEKTILSVKDIVKTYPGVVAIDLISYFSISPLLSLFFVTGFGVLPPFYPHFRGLPLFLTISCLKKTHGVLH